MESKDFVTSFHAKLHQLWADSELCDVQLCVEEMVIPAHRIILAALSPYFKAMFCSHLNERQEFQIRIQGLNAQAVKAVVQFAYTADLCLSEETVQSVMQTASMMQISAIEKLCCTFLLEHMYPENCLGIRDFAHVMGCFELKEAADKYCEDHFFDVSQSEEFFQLNVDEVIGLISRDGLRVAKEEEVYAAVMRWVEFDPERSKQDIVRIMEHVRLPLVQWDFLTKKISRDELFVSNEECRNYLQQARAFQASSYHPDLINFAFNEAVPRSHPRAFFSAADRLYSIGGESSSREILSSFESFSPYTNEAKELPPLPEAKRSLGVAILDKIIYAFGGASGFQGSRTVHAFDIDKQEWQVKSPMCEVRSSLVAAVACGNILALGGHGENSVLTSAEKYNVEFNSWTFIPELLEPRSMAAVVVIESSLYLCGGYNGLEDLRSCHVLDTKIWQWSVCPSMNERRSMHGAAVLDGNIYVAGGLGHNTCLSSAEVFHVSTQQWTVVQALPGARRGFGLTVIGDTLYAAGGHDGTSVQGSILKYNKSTGDWASIGHLITKRGRFGLL
ncbi:kelch-like protein 18 [Aplysia californica]|uniref:Kelch-like protein 18 n=1 Tax=Aplysia californica TaxID=6500 RepID=A0ABM1VQF1_APLCA|nr:kelch-like protein 18 [Aplysia californica]XP_035824643.1 kelch-like protein 18 [Aplysia californica]